MSRYIDADALIESICHTADLGGWIGDTLRNIKRLAVRYINSTPSIDIVRCGECKHRYDDGWIEPRWTCDYLKDMRLKDDDFCSYGQKGDENVETD